jgi:hypothetical protein
VNTAVGKVREWVRRYLPCELAGTAAELGGAAIAYAVTGSLAAAAVTATVGASVGYYATAYGNAVRWSCARHRHLPRRRRLLTANTSALRSVAVEFGPAELVDSLVIRPVAYYLGPQLFDSTAAGWVFGKLVADVGFYVCAIASYERIASVVHRRPRVEEVGDGHAPTTAAA